MILRQHQEKKHQSYNYNEKTKTSHSIVLIKKEDISKRKFEELIEPWVVCAWEQKDYGIDVIVEIHKLIDDTNDSHPSSKRFMIQLKSADSIVVYKRQFSYPVNVEKINYWYNSNLTVLFAVYHIPIQYLSYFIIFSF